MANRKIYKKLPNNYYNYFDICKFEGINANTAKSAVGSKGLEGINSLGKLKPIAHQFKEFPKYENGKLRNQYGILKTNYDFWKRNGRPRKQSPGRPPKWKENEELTNINIPIPKKLYSQFQQVVDNANAISVVKTTYRDMIYLAIQEFIQRRPQFLSNNDD